jgi:iron(III) transport system permease protein
MAIVESALAAPLPSRVSRGRGWRVAALVIGALVAAPMVVILSGWVSGENEVWRHLAATLLPDLLRNTAVLVLGVGSGVLVVGVGLAWLTATCEFPGRRVLDWALMLPLAVPAYVLAFVALGLLDVTGPVQAWLRASFGPDYWFPTVRSAGGVVVVMVLVLYPYVYMLARAAFLGQGRGMMEAARVLGLSPWAAFFRVALPMARPAIAAGMALALMETLADFGAVSVFNYDTFTTAIYKAWFELFNLDAAAQLASLLLLIVALALFGERRLRRGARFFETTRGSRAARFRLRGWRAAAAFLAAFTVLSLAFLVPLGQLLAWVWESGLGDLDARYPGLLGHTLTLGASAALVTLAAALVLSYAKRLHTDRLTRGAVGLATLGYALPGSVLAVGIMVAFTWVDRGIANLALTLFDATVYQVLAGTVGALVLAYVVRFMAAGFGAVDSAMERIRPSLSEAARSLGAGDWAIVRRIYLPMLRPGLLTGGLLVFVDVMKEMPATLLLRPFGWDTLAVRIFEMTSEGQWERAALPAVTLVLVGLVPVVLLVRRSAGGH